MITRKDCDYCETNIEFCKKDIKQIAYCKKGDKFIKTEKKPVALKMIGNTVTFDKVEFEVEDDLILKAIVCPVCGETTWLEKATRRGYINIKEDGWFLLEDGVIKAHKVSMKSNTYKISRHEAEGYNMGDIAERVMKKDVSKQEGVTQ